MKAKIVTYEHSANGISLQVIPETNEEESLLRGIWKHGKMELGNPCKERGGIGFYICWKQVHEQDCPPIIKQYLREEGT